MSAARSGTESLPPPTLSPRRLITSTVIGIVVIMAVVGVVGYYLREPMMSVSLWFVEHLGGFGVALGFFIPDAFTVPLPNDAFSLFGLAGGLGFWEVSAWATAGSLVGGCVGFFIGRSLRRTKRMQRFMAGRGKNVELLLQRYGVWAVGIAAITPLPYSIFCWSAGAAKMPFKPFFLVSLLRVFRVTGYLYLIQLGFFSIAGAPVPA